MKILSVDDNADNLYLIEAVGRAHGFQVASARNGLEALEQLKRQPFDLIVSDILMPEMDGFQLCHEVMSHERTRHIPFIFYTATYTAKQDQDLALSLGAARYVVKPVEPGEFMNIIEDVIGQAQRGGAGGPVAEPKGTVDYLNAYNARLVAKLDHKIEQLERTRSELQASVEARDREIAQRQRAEEELRLYSSELLETNADLRRAREEMKASRRMLQLVLDTIPLGVFWKGRDGRYLGCNRRFLTDSGFAVQDEVTGRGDSEMPWKEQAELFREEDRQVMETGQAELGCEKPVVGADGVQRWLRSSKVPLPDSTGAVVGVLGTHEDITDSKHSEEKLRRYGAQLVEANEDLRRFTQIVLHDLRAPLVNLQGFAAELRHSIDTIRKPAEALLANLPEPERAAVAQALQGTIPEALGFIENSVTSMDRLTGALLRLSRAGRRELHMEELDVEALVQEAVSGLAQQFQGGNIAFQIGPLPRITSDRAAIKQIFGHLLDNAIKYLDPQRAGRIEVSAVETEDASVFRVRDNGRGIAADDMDKVFQPFRRAGDQDVPGEGMGLAFVRTSLHRLGGRIECHSQLGVGTTFGFMLPRVG